jgi:hypothetical protein
MTGTWSHLRMFECRVFSAAGGYHASVAPLELPLDMGSIARFHHPVRTTVLVVSCWRASSATTSPEKRDARMHTYAVEQNEQWQGCVRLNVESIGTPPPDLCRAMRRGGGRGATDDPAPARPAFPAPPPDPCRSTSPLDMGSIARSRAPARGMTVPGRVAVGAYRLRSPQPSMALPSAGGFCYRSTSSRAGAGDWPADDGRAMVQVHGR